MPQTDQSAAAGPRWVIFDLDETIVDHDTSQRFLGHLLKRSLPRRIAALLALPIVAPLLVTNRWKPRGASILLWIATVGTNEHQRDALLNE